MCPPLGAAAEKRLGAQVLGLDVLDSNLAPAADQRVALGRSLSLTGPQAPVKWEGYY